MTSLTALASRFGKRHGLSQQETKLLLAALGGLNNDEVASELRCARATISTYWNRIFRKVGVSGQRDVLVALLKWIVEESEPPSEWMAP